jgi:hypothetical protein
MALPVSTSHSMHVMSPDDVKIDLPSVAKRQHER